ncbi:MAG: hypothetical protein WEB00_03025 [Dehalococcoidia bacterium]
MLRIWQRQSQVAQKAARAATLPRRVFRAGRDVVAAVGAGVVLGAIGWELLEQKTRGYWTNL